MEYTKVKIYIGEESMDEISSMLIDMGISGIEIEEPETYSEFLNKKNIYDWDYIDSSLEVLSNIPSAITFYIEDNPEGIELIDEILESIRAFNVESVEISGVDDEDWKHKWKEYFKPVRITGKLVVKPSWESYEKQPGEMVIEIDPGMAFGTGTHPTTSLCVKLLEEYISENTPAVLDVGCGSGILSIASALLGAKEVLGVEIDPQAVEVAKKNIDKNNLDKSVKIITGDLTKGLDVKADILVANLMADLVIKLSGYAPAHLKPGGIFISSGILIEKKDEVAAAVESCGFDILSIPEEGEWCAIAAVLK